MVGAHFGKCAENEHQMSIRFPANRKDGPCGQNFPCIPFPRKAFDFPAFFLLCQFSPPFPQKSKHGWFFSGDTMTADETRKKMERKKAL